ncbi:beta-ketoacyl-[acyl-carrier-protein] synthase family protein [Anaerobaca lacustris]|uniref:Beta-ketoacyl-[acyl-carrier-protein] synthase family protein n=1 Tax=Anaerobaca lacustris TaxID=3044600 RepID=A0AAW6TUK2_9BACT|nr:beta-ketoacyl-[acyl-carrier-protein] synthase family protein [Sedimentisphaerales bacterium M17dextr]
MKTPTTHERVVITGMGIVSPLGTDVETVWQAILAGSSGAAPTTIFDASTFPTTFSAEVKDYDFRRHIRQAARHEGCSRSSGFAIGAAVQACRQAGIDVETPSPADGIDRTRMGIYLGAGEGSLDSDAFFAAIIAGWNPQTNEFVWPNANRVVFKQMQATKELEQEPNMAAAHVATLTGARGPTRSCLTACAASTQAVGEAMMLVRHGQADVVIAGGAHSMIHILGLTGFNRLTALSRRNDSPETASRPFCASRDGFVLGEGAAIVVLESLTSARRRGATILAELIGYGSSSDAFRVTDMHHEGRGAVQAMTSAMADAALTYRDIDYINTHGTSTQENDSVETLAIKTVFKERAKQVPASSVKSMLGHLIAAAGAAELITCVLAMRDAIVPPTINLNDPDPELDLDYVPNVPRKMPVRIAMNESFGFGGQNNVVILKQYSEAREKQP